MPTKTALPIVRAADVGYGHIKWTDGRDPEKDVIRCDRCPSLSPPARELGAAAGVMQSRDTFHVDVGGRRYEVGKAVHRAMHANQESSVMDQDFCLSDAYQARLYGALNYMSMGIEGGRIDFLILGLPMNIYLKHADAVAERYKGLHTINIKGDRLAIGRCIVYPQPLGSYADFLDSAAIEGSPNALVVDVGFNTVDWFVCQGMTASLELSGATLRGMGAVLRAIAEDIIATTDSDAGPTEVARLLDRSLTAGTPFTLCGHAHDYTPQRAAGHSVVDEAAQAIKNAIGSGADIDHIIITGGGADWYAKALSSKFPKHPVTLLKDPAFANVRGFHLLGDLMAGSAHRATAGVDDAAVAV